MPNIFVIGGPNGAGKTTAARKLLPDRLHCIEYVNADYIAAGISPYNADSVAIEAGRLMLERINTLLERRADFAFETTLASRSFAMRFPDWQQIGYSVTVIYIWIPSPELSVERVAERVRAGGHFIPEDVIKRRYHKGRRNFLDLYMPRCNIWRVFDNSGQSPGLIASGAVGEPAVVIQPEIWKIITKV